MDSIKRTIGSSNLQFSSQYLALGNNTTGAMTSQVTNLPLASTYTSQFTQVFGEEALNALLSLSVNGVSAVIEGPSGYFIFMLQGTTPAKILTLTDQVSSSQAVTVGDYIKNILYQQKYAAAQTTAQQNLLSQLRTNTTITINEANLARVIN
jgi:hypothetical protein